MSPPFYRAELPRSCRGRDRTYTTGTKIRGTAIIQPYTSITTGDRTRTTRLKVSRANHYTMVTGEGSGRGAAQPSGPYGHRVPHVSVRGTVAERDTTEVYVEFWVYFPL
jgi:hypothetical protein